jgi:hypothetical protein
VTTSVYCNRQERDGVAAGRGPTIKTDHGQLHTGGRAYRTSVVNSDPPLNIKTRIDVGRSRESGSDRTNITRPGQMRENLALRSGRSRCWLFVFRVLTAYLDLLCGITHFHNSNRPWKEPSYPRLQTDIRAEYFPPSTLFLPCRLPRERQDSSGSVERIEL